MYFFFFFFEFALYIDKQFWPLLILEFLCFIVRFLCTILQTLKIYQTWNKTKEKWDHSTQLIARFGVFKSITGITISWAHEKLMCSLTSSGPTLSGENSSRFDRHLQRAILKKMGSNSRFCLSHPSYTSSSSYKCNCWLLGSLPSL